MTSPSSPSYRLLAIHAHPDDESSKGAATMARYVDEGHRVKVVTCTGGERGDILNPMYSVPGEVGGFDDFEGLSLYSELDRLAWMRLVRRQEMMKAAQILGIEHEWLGYVDSGLPEGDPLPPLPPECFAHEPAEQVACRLVRIIREFQPHVVVTYDERGGYPHPDHLLVHEASMLAVDLAADETYQPELGQIWSVPKVYYTHGFVPRRFQMLIAEMERCGMVVGDDIRQTLQQWSLVHQVDDRITTRVPVAPWFERRDDALRAHGTQIDPEGPFLFCPVEIQQRVWPTEEFELVRSHFGVPAQYSEAYETDLFAGL